MAKYRNQSLADLAHQLKLSPARLRLKQLDATEDLVDLLEPDKRYPYEFVCHQITGYRPRGEHVNRVLTGSSLIEDLILLLEELSLSVLVPLTAMPMPCWSTEELAKRLQVSTKTICRWRRRGLPGRKLRYPDRSVRMAFTERSIRRFVVRHQDLVKRGAAFKQLSEKEKEQIVEMARQELSDHRVRLHELSQLISAKMSRAVETIRYTLRRYDQDHPESALFGQDEQPLIDPRMQEIYNASAIDGLPPEAVGRRFGRSVRAIMAIVREVRARLLMAREIAYIHNSEFCEPDADERILSKPEKSSVGTRKRPNPPADLPPYLQDMYRQPLLEADQERDIFRRYNYLKYKAHRLRCGLDILNADVTLMDRIEALLADAERVKNDILRANLRLVVSIARRHVGQAACFFEVVSDGNLALMRAVEKFDYARGFKFSTYASWAIMRNYARIIPEQMYQSARLVTGMEEVLSATAEQQDETRESLVEHARHLIRKGLALLTARERDILVRHYGLRKNEEAMTLEQIGGLLGVTKERVRQIERKALAKLRMELPCPEEV
ncbi:MAG: sigma-70 family RNA polymerase sigma factor [Phycisphaerales bacterium]|nr:sigma-70 family RNA polymerase sigma factor [Phycisphaerales bacterium]